jgi:hypothetical protein
MYAAFIAPRWLWPYQVFPTTLLPSDMDRGISDPWTRLLRISKEVEIAAVDGPTQQVCYHTLAASFVDIS